MKLLKHRALLIETTGAEGVTNCNKASNIAFNNKPLFQQLPQVYSENITSALLEQTEKAVTMYIFIEYINT